MPHFLTYALAGAFAFSGLLVCVASSPIIFMEVFHVSPQQFGTSFAGLSVGFIGSKQINVLLLRKFSSEQILRATLLGFFQISVAGLATASIGIFDSHTMLPVTLVLAATSWIGFGILIIGKRRIHGLRLVRRKRRQPAASMKFESKT